MNVTRLLIVVASVAAVAAVGATPTATPGQSYVVVARGFLAGDHVSVPGRDDLVLVGGLGRYLAFPVLAGNRVLPWPVTMRVQGLR